MLNEVSFTVAPGQIIALLGPPGAGKTSLVNLLPRFYEYTSGSITLDEVELSDYPRIYLRSQIGIVEQGHQYRQSGFTNRRYSQNQSSYHDSNATHRLQVYATYFDKKR